ncbi:hypothetical protein K1X76_08475 [bacterium]|nr:hypothetical protein [bacterium]
MNIHKISFFLILIFLSLSAKAEPLMLETITNHYQIFFEGGDHGTADFQPDGAFIYFPDSTNRDYARTCTASYKFDKKKQTIRIKKDADPCEFFLGTYNVTRKNHNLILYNAEKTLMFRTLKQMPR